MQFTDHHIATFILAAPFLALCVGGLVVQYFAIRSEVARRRRVRAWAQREGDR
jgi:hypothetical protein